MTTSSIHALMTRLIDYAGLFPPAKLDMTTTVRNYADYLSSSDSWMLGRLIVPVARLDEFDAVAQQGHRQSAIDDAGPWQLSALASAAGSPELPTDLARIETFNQRHADDGGGLAMIDTLEIKADSPDVINATLDLLSGDVFAFFEVDVNQDPSPLVAAMAGQGCGAKVRTGGLTPQSYPSSSALARFIHVCAAENVPCKATAGMHHPLRHQAGSNGVDEHGFLNFFVAACLALTNELSESEIQSLLEERNASALRFEDDAIVWRKHRLRTENIEDVREEFAISFGSCSFDEPRQDLRKLGLLSPATVHAG